MKIFIAGIDGYLGWPLAQYLAIRGHEIGGADNFFRRRWVEEMGSCSALPIAPMTDRIEAFSQEFGQKLHFWDTDLCTFSGLRDILGAFAPDAIVHLGECPSAPYSMIDADHATFTQTNNICSTLNLLFAMRDICPQAHLLKLGTMGEYGTPNVAIPEGFFEVEFRGRKDRMPFPRQAKSWYHWSKVHDSNNVMFACDVWRLRATDVMQGIVFGTRLDDTKRDGRMDTRLDFDQAFGTVINRFCCQAVISHPLTVYGHGGQTRGLLPLRDSMQCITIALENPPQAGEYRVFNQFESVHNVFDLALKVRKVAQELGKTVDIGLIENPRQELEDHYYNPDRKCLDDLGYKPSNDIESELKNMIIDLAPHHDRIKSKVSLLIPDVRWDGQHEKGVISALLLAQ
jgi:UDP-sulfoquinovose synthase